MKNLLAIDTSTERASVALCFKGTFYSRTHAHYREHAQFLLSMIDEVLAEAGGSLSELEGVVFGSGPGSFTGLRIACSVAKGLAFAHDLPVYPINTLQAIALQAQTEGVPQSASILACIDARMDELYWALFNAQLQSEATRVTPAEKIAVPDGEIILAGFGFESYRARLPSKLQTQIINALAVYPDAKNHITLVHKGIVDAVSAEAAQPFYVRNQVTHGGQRG